MTSNADDVAARQRAFDRSYKNTPQQARIAMIRARRAEAARSEYVFIDAGTIDGTRYVDVIYRDGGDPMQYGLPLGEAVRDYGNSQVMTMAEWAES